MVKINKNCANHPSDGGGGGADQFDDFFDK